MCSLEKCNNGLALNNCLSAKTEMWFPLFKSNYLLFMAYRTPQLISKILNANQIYCWCLFVFPLGTHSKNSSPSTKKPFIPFKLLQHLNIPLKSLHAFGNIFTDYIALETFTMMSSHWRVLSRKVTSLWWCVFFFFLFLFIQLATRR